MKSSISRILIISLIIFVVSIGYLFFTIEEPEYGGDEIWFATPLLGKSVLGLRPFEFVYAGPEKTLLSYYFFETLGFNIFTVRSFTILTYIIGVIVWCMYLWSEKLRIASISSLIFFSLNADLLFFAKVDYNQPTFHNLFFILYLVFFFHLLKNHSSTLKGILFIFMGLLFMNLHIRNIWVINAFMFTVFLNFILFESKNSHRNNLLKSFISRYWPIIISFFISAIYFLYVNTKFASHPLVKLATESSSKISYAESMLRSFKNMLSYNVGGNILYSNYASPTEAKLVLVLGLVMAIVAIIGTAFFLRKKHIIALKFPTS